MMKNEYRRALILLRPTQAGTSGHVRLERRTLVGSMQFTLSGMQSAGALQAAMAAKTSMGWKIVHIGTLGRDARGQAGLNWTFDPRSIEGLPLERYSVLLVLETGADSCRTLFTGYVNGSVQVDWERVEQAACAGYIAAPQTAQDTEQEEQGESENTVPDAQEEQCGADNIASDASQGQTGKENTDRAAQEVQTGTENIDRDAPEEQTGADNIASDAPEEQTGTEIDPDAQLPGTTPIFREPAAECEKTAEAALAELDAPALAPEPDIANRPAEDDASLDAPAMSSAGAEREDGPLDVPARAAQTALEALGLDAGERWPEAIEPLRAAFAASAPVFLGAQPDHVFVKTAHAPHCPECAVGLRAENGAPRSVAYAIPGGFSEQPPEGLEGYRWRDGWWIAVADAESGAYMHI